MRLSTSQSFRADAIHGRAAGWMVFARLFAMLLLVAGGAYVGAKIWIKQGERGSFYQSEYGTAFSLACGKGFRNIAEGAAKPVGQFLAGKAAAPGCDEVFSNPATTLVAPNVLQEQTVSLQYLFAGLWKFFSFDWKVAAAITAGLTALLGFATFYLARQFFGFWPAIAVGLTGSLAVGPLQRYIVDVRDFSKAPFAILLIGLFLALLFQPRQRLIPLAALSALALSVGAGFRSDVSVFFLLIPIALAVRFFNREGWKSATVALVVFFAVAAAYNQFILRYSDGLGRNFPHFVILGHATQFMTALGLEAASQGQMHFYNDHYVHQLVRMFASSMGEAEPGYATTAYDAMGQRFLVELAKLFPANEMTVAMSAVYRSLFSFMGKRDGTLLLLFASTSIILTGFLHWRGVALVAIAVFFGGLAGVQFDERHYFHIFLIGVIMLAAAAVALALSALRFAAQRNVWLTGIAETLQPVFLPSLKKFSPRMAAGTLIVFIAFFAILAAARVVQTSHIEKMVETIGKFEKKFAQPIAVTPAEIRFDMKPFVNGGYFGVALQGAEFCKTARPAVSVNYLSDNAFYAWSFALAWPLGKVDAAYFPAPATPPHNGLDTVTVKGLPDGCDVRVFQVQPNAKFVPFTFYAGALNEPAYHRHNVVDGLANATTRIKLALGQGQCVLRSAPARGGQSSQSFEQKVTMPAMIAISVDPGPDGYASDHLDIGDAVIETEHGAVRLSTMQMAYVEAPVLALKRDMNILDKPMRVGGEVFASGFGTHAPTRFALRVPEDIRGLTGTLRFRFGIDDQTAGAGTVAVSVCLVN